MQAIPVSPTIYRQGEVAEAEPAVPAWSIQVDGLFVASASFEADPEKIEELQSL